MCLLRRKVDRQDMLAVGRLSHRSHNRLDKAHSRSLHRRALDHQAAAAAVLPAVGLLGMAVVQAVLEEHLHSCRRRLEHRLDSRLRV